MVCTGSPPYYFTPGFGRLALSWGWLFLGMLLGSLAGYIALSSWPYPPPRPDWTPLLAQSSHVEDGPHHRVDRAMVESSPHALTQAATQMQTAEIDALARILAYSRRDATPSGRQPNVCPRGIHQTPAESAAAHPSHSQLGNFAPHSPPVMFPSPGLPSGLHY